MVGLIDFAKDLKWVGGSLRIIHKVFIVNEIIISNKEFKEDSL